MDNRFVGMKREERSSFRGSPSLYEYNKIKLAKNQFTTYCNKVYYGDLVVVQKVYVEDKFFF